MPNLLRSILPLLGALMLAPATWALPLTQYGGSNSLIRVTNSVANGNCSLPAGNECASAVSLLPVANYSDPGYDPIIGGGSVEAGALHGFIGATRGLGGGISGNLDVAARDQFTVVGPSAGETISITAHLLATGTATIQSATGLATVEALLGDAWGATYGGVSGFLDIGSASTGYVSNTSVPLSAEAVYTFDVVTGTSFLLSYGMRLRAASYALGTAEADFLDTATLSFDLPAGYTISSEGGFGVPEPASALLVGLGLAALGAAGRRR